MADGFVHAARSFSEGYGIWLGLATGSRGFLIGQKRFGVEEHQYAWARWRQSDADGATEFGFIGRHA